MITIYNKSNNTLKSFELIVKNDSLSVTKTEQDCPIFSTINIDLSGEFNVNKNVTIKLKLLYKDNKTQIVQGSNYKVGTNIEITTYGSNKKLSINTNCSNKEAEIVDENIKNYKIIYNLVNQYMEDHLINNKISAKDNAEAAKQSSLIAKEYMDKAKEYSEKALKTTIEGYSDVIEDVESLKSSKAISLIDNKTAEGSILINKIYGMTEVDNFVDGENCYTFKNRVEEKYGITLTESSEDNSITLNGKCTESNSYHFATRDNSQNKLALDLKPDTIYKIIGVPHLEGGLSTLRLLTNYTNKDGIGIELTSDYGGGGYFTIKSSEINGNKYYKGIGFLINFYKGAEFNNYKIYPRIIEVGKILKPSPYQAVRFNNSVVKFNIENDNLIPFPYSGHRISDFPFVYTFNGITYKFNEDGSVVLNGQTNETTESSINILSPYNFSLARKLILGQTYYISDGRAEEGFHANGYIQFIRIKKDGTLDGYANTSNGTLVYTHTDPEYVKWGIRVNVSKNKIAKNVIVKPMVSIMADNKFTIAPTIISGKSMIRQSLEMKQYENNAVNTNIILSSLQVPNDYEDFNLDIGGTHYVSDTLEKVDGGYQIVRRVGIRDNLKYGYIGTKPSYCAISDESLKVDDFVRADISQGYIYGEMNCFVKADGGIATYKGDNGNGTYCIVGDKPRLFLRNDDCKNQQEWKEYLNSHNIVFRGILKTPIIENVSVEDAQKLLNIKTFEGFTCLTQVTEVDGIIEAEYATNRKTALTLTGYVQAEKNKILIKELQTAMLNMASI